MTDVLKANDKDLDKAAGILAAGGVVAFPTETVYGIGADATNASAVDKVFAAKNRPHDNPLIVTVSGPEMVDRFAKVDARAKKLMQTFWPGSLTLLLPLVDDQVLPKNVTAGLNTAAFRNPDSKVTRQLITLLNNPIVGPSANLSTKPSPTTAAHVLHDMDGRIDAVIDDGPSRVGVESTIVDLSVADPAILRPGAVSADQIAQVIGQKVIDPTSPIALSASSAPKAPGMKYRHYAPSKPVVIFDPLDKQELKDRLNETDAVVAYEQLLYFFGLPAYNSWSLGATPQTAAEELFSALRAFDDRQGIERIFVQSLAKKGIGEAYMNRLEKSAGGQHLSIQ
ncbi:L-threonylcarbamoyladenylate synthase [Oenococcus alcoholitolerans]|uniref:L-threonylcarbamoyladenylate synthase n=1 Tax=Oenococcus alcoholitolerans TaxID=931074 RepID=UPI003F71FADC